MTHWGKMERSEAREYLEKVLDGRITACKRMKQLAEMMLPRFDEGYKRWHFDIKKARKPIRFIEGFCKLPSGKANADFILEDYEKMVIEIAFGFVDDEGNRQFQDVLVIWARKNGKTSLGAAIELYMLVGDGEFAPQVYNVANSKPQASLAYGACLSMMRQSEDLSERLRKGVVPERGNQDGIIDDESMGYITPLSNQTRNLDGLNPHFALIDELSAIVNRDLYDLVKQAISARDQPMIMKITTNGFERDELFDEEYKYACGILDGKIVDDRVLPIIFELDERNEWTDESCWKKANPGLGTVKKWDALRDNVNKAKQDPSFLPTVLTKDFNIPENRASSWLSRSECVFEEPFEMERGMFRYGIAGFDASDTTDLSAGKILMMRPGDPKMYLLSMYWIPEESLTNRSGYRRERDDVPYREWERRGLLRIVPGNKVHRGVFLEWLEEVKDEYDVWTFAIGYDPWGFQGTDGDMLEDYVGKEHCEAVRQGAQTFSTPMKQLQADYRSGLVVDGHNPVNEWCRGNVMIERDKNDNIRPLKASGKAKNRIDGFIAELCAYIAYMRHRDEYEGLI